MTRGYSLEQDLRLLINNSKYGDVEILCEDEKKLYGNRAILAARSEVFERLLYNGMKESYEKLISFPEINSFAMKIILEYIYTGSIKEGTLTKDNIIEAFYAADYFQLPNLQDFIIKTVKDNLNKNYPENYSPELLSKIVKTMPLSGNNSLLNLLVEAVAVISLNTIEFGRLSIAALQYLLSCTHEKEIAFVTPEYEVFRYCAILAAKQVSNDAYGTLTEWLPTLEQLRLENLDKIGNEFIIIDHQKVAKELEPLIKFIDFSQIKGKYLADIIEPLEIIPAKIVLDTYRQKVRTNNSDLNGIRGISYIWDESACGSNLIIRDNGKVVQASRDCNKLQNVKAKMALVKGIYEWNIVIEKISFSNVNNVFVGVCAENLCYGTWAGDQSTGWVLSSTGRCCTNKMVQDYCPSFRHGMITVHLDMNKRTCAFTVNGTRYPEVPGWNLPSKLYPVVSLSYPSCFRIQNSQVNSNK